jgi:sterol desaturase/sphingolipid hydroxylase (fatty acid hydroxylase superfamily)
MTVNSVALRLLSAGGATGMAVFASEHRWGLLSAFPFPAWLGFIVSLLVLDFAIYGQHVLFHKIPWLWRLHRVHHSDVDFDTTTAIRFHPLEIVLSMIFKMGLVLAIGVPPIATLAFEALLNACAQFNHGNVRLSPAAERFVRRFLITPDLHRIHHSCDPIETDTNFGFSIPLWDRLCGTYQAEPSLGQRGMRVGLAGHKPTHPLTLARLLDLPFRN